MHKFSYMPERLSVTVALAVDDAAVPVRQI